MDVKFLYTLLIIFIVLFSIQYFISLIIFIIKEYNEWKKDNKGFESFISYLAFHKII